MIKARLFAAWIMLTAAIVPCYPLPNHNYPTAAPVLQTKSGHLPAAKHPPLHRRRQRRVRTTFPVSQKQPMISQAVLKAGQFDHLTNGSFSVDGFHGRIIRQRSARVRPSTEARSEYPVEEILSAGYPWSSPSHVSYRYRYKFSNYYYPPKSSQQEDPTVDAGTTIDPCVLARWNRELPFTELPNMAADLLASDMRSGETIVSKARFIGDLLQLSLQSYLQMDSAGDVFEIPQGFDLKKCNFKKYEDPLLKSINRLLNLYSSTSAATEPLHGLVKAAKACVGKEDQSLPIELLPCLDFSFGSEQVLRIKPYRSIFGNQELCRTYFRHENGNCTSKEPHACSTEHIEALTDFARTFYQCPEIDRPQPGGRKRPGDRGSAPEDEHEPGLALLSKNHSWTICNNLHVSWLTLAFSLSSFLMISLPK